MNEVVIKESGKKKLREMKRRIIDLRGILECCEDTSDIEQLKQRLSGARFMHDIYEVGVLKDSRIAAVRKRDMARYRRIVMWLVKAVTVAVLLAIIFLSASGCQFVSGCGTAIKGFGGDIQWMADGYMEEMNK